MTLSVTPFRRIARYGNLIEVRRMLGVGAFCYIAAHLTLYIADQSYDLGKVAYEITHRWYLIIGGTAWLGLAVLAATSTDGMVSGGSAACAGGGCTRSSTPSRCSR